jgi:hypothetical protein
MATRAQERDPLTENGLECRSLRLSRRHIRLYFDTSIPANDVLNSEWCGVVELRLSARLFRVDINDVERTQGFYWEISTV